MALRILREIAFNIRSSVFYTIMADETADVSNKEQLVICILGLMKILSLMKIL